MDIVIILEKLQAMNMIRLHRIIGNYYQCYCPIHNNGNERRPSFGVLIHDEYRNGQLYPAGFCHCFACGYAKGIVDLITDILKSRSISMSGLQWLQDNIPGFQFDADIDTLIAPDTLKQLNNKFAINYITSINTSMSTEISEEELASYRYTVPYMYSRGLTDELICRYDIGVDMNYIPKRSTKKVPTITFPVRDIKGSTLFIVRRSIEGKRFFLPEHVVKPLYGVYELPNRCNKLMIVESCFNCLTAVKYGYPAVALLGTGTPYQINKLMQLGIKEFTLCFDGDEAGEKAARRMKSALRNCAIVRTIHMPADKDVNDCSYEQFQSLYEARI